MTVDQVKKDVIDEKPLIKKFGVLQNTTYTQIYRAFKEKMMILGLDPSKRWTQYMQYFRLFLGGHNGLLKPDVAMGDEAEARRKNQILTGSKWSGFMDEEHAWNREIHGGQKVHVPMLNHKPNTSGYDTVTVADMKGRRMADMDATLTFR